MNPAPPPNTTPFEGALDANDPSAVPLIALKVNPGRFFFIPPTGAPALPPPVPIVGRFVDPVDETREFGAEVMGRVNGGGLPPAGIDDVEDDLEAI